jgi:hypothetical protein
LVVIAATGVVMAAAVGIAGALGNATGVDFSATAGEQFTGAVARFSDIEPGAVGFSATIDWGDGTPASAGTFASQGLCPDVPDQTCYEVHGTHTYAAAGSYAVTTSISTGPDQPTRVTSTATVAPSGPPPNPPPNPAPPPGPAATTAIDGPGELTIGDLARFAAVDSTRAIRHEWDLDGDGTFETDTGTTPVVDRAFDDDGRLTIGLRSTFPDGSTAIGKLLVVVERPPLIALQTVPANPKPGQRFSLKLNFIHEADAGFGLITWKISGAKPAKQRTILKLAGKTPPTSVRAKGAMPTLATEIKAKIEQPGYYPIKVTVQDEKGGVYSLTSGVNVTSKASAGQVELPKQTLDCNQKPPSDSSYEVLYLYGLCADIAILGEPVEGGVLNIENASPDLISCKDLPVPVQSFKKFDVTIFEKSFSPAGFTPTAGQSFAASSGRHARSAAQKQCVVLQPSRVIQWDFGDGESFAYPADPGGPEVIPHTYAKPGTYKVSLLADVPYRPADYDIVKDFDPNKTGVVRSRRTVTVEVGEQYCGSVLIRGVAAKPVPVSTYESQGIPACFNKTGGASAPQYTTLKGYGLDFGGLAVSGKKLDKFLGAQQRDFGLTQLVVDPKAATITPKPPVFEAKTALSSGPQPSSVLVGFPKLAGLSATGYAFRGPQLGVPKPVFDAGFGAAVAKVGEVSGSSAGLNVGGLKAKTVQTFVSPGGGPFARAWLELPPPLAGTPPVDLPPGGAKAASHWGEATDFSIDIGGLGLGLFELPGSFALEHKTAGGWIGGGQLQIPLLGSLGSKIDAPYKPPPTGSPPSQCTKVTGPSGIALNGDGSFAFGGATAIFGSQVPVGPIGLGCIAVRGQSVPFVMEGRVSGSLPKDGPLDINGCFLLGVLGKAEQASGCGTTRKAGGATLVWLRSTGSIGVFDKFTLGGASLDFTTEGGSATAVIKGSAEPSFGPITVSLDADGAMLFPSLAFDLGVEGKIWGHVSVPYPCPSLSDPLDICWEEIDSPHVPLGSAIISSKGFGFCGGPFGVTFKAGGSVDAGLCDLSGLAVATASAAGDGTLRLRVRRGLSEVAFVLRSAENSPVVDLVDPGGRRIKDPLGSWRVTGRDYRLFHLDGETVVYVDRPKPGTWRFAPHHDSPAVSSLSAQQVLAAPRIEGKVTGKGRQRVLAYRARLAAGDRIRLVEVSRASSRSIGILTKGGHGRIRFGTGTGPRGKRTIFAIAERRGAPFDRFAVTTYTAPKPQAVPSPQRVEIAFVHGRLGVRWRRVKGAESYDVLARLSDGRVLRARARGEATRFDGVAARIGMRVSVTAIARDGRRSKPARARKRSSGPARVTINV